jgi:hypothetical protein
VAGAVTPVEWRPVPPPRLGRWHIVSVALVLLWVHGVCGCPSSSTVLLYAYPGLSLTLLRSFCEASLAGPPSGRAHSDHRSRTVMSLAFTSTIICMPSTTPSQARHGTSCPETPTHKPR